jgi:hypothetical protein
LGANARERFLSVYEQSRVVAAQADWLEKMTAPPQARAGKLLFHAKDQISDTSS